MSIILDDLWRARSLPLCLDEGTRLVSNLCEVAPEGASIGMDVEVLYVEFDGGLVVHQFRPVVTR